MKTIYIVTSGEYSDYGIDAVFSSEELANDYIARDRKAGSIEEYKLDCRAIPLGFRWRVVFNEDNSVYSTGSLGAAYDDDNDIWDMKNDNVYIPDRDFVYVIVRKNEEHLAIKVASDIYLNRKQQGLPT